MATKLSLLSLAELEAENGSSWTCNPKNPRNPSQRDEEDEDSNWEVQAFAEDYTASTWPPKSYSCSVCKREFRSAQALGGHMNVHRRDRISRRIHRLLPPQAATSSATSGLVIPAVQELIPPAGNNGGMCSFYLLPLRNDYRTSGDIVTSANSISTMNVKSYTGVEDLDLELRLGTGR